MSVKCYRSFSGQPLTAALGSLSPVDTFTPVANEPRVFVSSEGLDADPTTPRLGIVGLCFPNNRDSNPQPLHPESSVTITWPRRPSVCEARAQ